MARPKDIWLRVVWILPVVLTTNLLFPGQNSFRLVVWSLIGIVCAVLMGVLSMRWLLFVRRRYTSIEQTRRRVLVTFAGYLIITSSLLALLFWCSSVTDTNSMPITGDVYAQLIAVAFFGVLVMGSIVEFSYYVHKYREAVQESESVKKASLQRQYDRFRNQVNPHFLFNSLNSLAALIAEDPQKAGQFLDELSSLYRYLLQAGQYPLVTLAEEMTFLHAYRYLLDTRFGNALRWEVTVNQRLMDHYLPPLTLQTLLENALRHNLLLPQEPLTLHIATTDDDALVVCNAIQRKKAAVLSPQGGLTILAARYESLGLSSPVIDDDGQYFKVRLPLISKDQALDSSLVTNTEMP